MGNSELMNLKMHIAVLENYFMFGTHITSAELTYMFLDLMKAVANHLEERKY